MVEKKPPINEEYFGTDKPITSTELEYILDVNKKSISIYNEVGQQNEEIIEVLEKIETKTSEVVTKSELEKLEKKIEEIHTNVLRLTVFLGAIGIGTIIQFFIQILRK